jgi:hypothetical protein
MKRHPAFAFERNLGQTGPQVKFLARAQNFTLYLTATGATVALRNADSSAALRISLLGANASSAVMGTDAA